MASDSTVVISPKAATTVVIGKVVGGDGITSITSSDGTLAITRAGTNYDAIIAQQGATQGNVLSWDSAANKFVPAPPEGSGIYDNFVIPLNASGQMFTSPSFRSYASAMQMIIAHNGVILRPNIDYTFDPTTDTITVTIYLRTDDILVLNPQGPNTGVGNTRAVTLVNSGTGLTGGPITSTGTLSIADIPGLVVGTYGGLDPVTNTFNLGQFTVNQQGQLTNATRLAVSLPVAQLAGILPPSKGGTGINNVDSNTLTLAGAVSFPSGFTTIIRGTASTDVTLPVMGTLATLSNVETLTNKTIVVSSATGNIITGIPNSSLVNSGITLGSTTYNLGSSTLTLAGLTSVSIVVAPNTIYPTQATQLATKAYVDNVSTGLAPKMPCVVATTGANITLTGLQTIDGVLLVAGNRVLVKDQTDPTQNGIYDASTTAWARSSDSSTYPNLVRASVFVSLGTVNAKTNWGTNIPTGGSFGTTPIIWFQTSALASYTAGTGLNLTGNIFSLPPAGVTAGAYGSASRSVSLAVNAQGVITSASDTSIAIAMNQVVSGILPPSQGGTGINNNSTIRLASNFTTVGAFGLTLTTTAATNVTLPTSGVLATLSGVSIFTNKTISLATGQGNSITAIPNASLINSSVTIGTTALSLGATSLTLNGLTSVTVTQDPSTNLQLATKQYVDNKTTLGANTDWTDPTAISVNDLFIGFCNSNIPAGSTFVASNTSSFPMYLQSTYFPSNVAGNECGIGMAVATVGTSDVLVVTTADADNLSSVPLYTRDGGTYLPVSIAGNYPPPIYLTFGNSYFVGVSSDARYISYSFDGVSWAQRDLNLSIPGVYRLKFDLDRFFITAPGGTYTLSNPALDNYTQLPENAFPANFGPRYNEAGFNNRYYFTGRDTAGVTNVPIVSVSGPGTATITFGLSLVTAPSLATIDVGRFITISGVIPSTYNNVDSGVNLQIIAVNNAAKTITVTYPSLPGTYVSGGTLTVNAKVCSLDMTLGNVRYEPFYNAATPPTDLFSLISGPNTLAVMGNILPVTSYNMQDKYVYYSTDGLTWNRSTVIGLDDPRITTQVVQNVRYWIVSGQRSFFSPTSELAAQQGYLYVSPDPMTPSSFVLLRPLPGNLDYNRTGVINNILVVGTNGGVVECRATNNIYVGPQNLAVPAGTYRCLGQTTDLDPIYMFKRTA